MKHEIVLDGLLFRIRPVSTADAAFIVGLRNQPGRDQYIHATPKDEALQAQWIENYFRVPGDYYFIVENRQTGLPEGTIGVYGIDDTRSIGEWGRWVILSGSRAAFEALVLACETAFERLRLQTVYSITVANNVRSLSFQRRFGMEDYAIHPAHIHCRDNTYDAIELRMSRSRFRQLRPVYEQAASDIGAKQFR